MKKIFSILLIALAVMLLSACAPQEKEIPYGAKLFDKAESVLTDDYLAENETHYPSLEDGLPKSRCRTITDDNEFERAFKSFPEELDFSHDVLVVYFFSDLYYGFDCKLSDITQNENKTVIIVEHEMAKPDANGAESPSTSMPIRRCLAIKLTDCDISEVEVSLIYS